MRLEENWFEIQLENENTCYIPTEYKKRIRILSDKCMGIQSKMVTHVYTNLPNRQKS